MSFNTFFDTTQSESSQVSSVDDHIESPQSETTAPENSRLAELKRLARKDAERRQIVVEDRKLRKTKDKRGKITKSKRQTSNIRSAEICRAAKGIYIERLEHEILKEEEIYLQMMKDMLDQAAADVRLKHRIARLEEQINSREEEKTSWMTLRNDETTDVEVDEFFLVSENDVPMQWDHERCIHTDAWNTGIEICEGEDERMDFTMENAPMTPPPRVELDIPCTPQKEKQYGIEYDKEKMLRSPVAVFDLDQELDEEALGLKLRPNISVTVCNK